MTGAGSCVGAGVFSVTTTSLFTGWLASASRRRSRLVRKVKTTATTSKKTRINSTAVIFPFMGEKTSSFPVRARGFPGRRADGFKKLQTVYNKCRKMSRPASAIFRIFQIFRFSPSRPEKKEAPGRKPSGRCKPCPKIISANPRFHSEKSAEAPGSCGVLFLIRDEGSPFRSG